MATLVVVEYAHDPPISEQALADQIAQLTPCLEVREIRWVRSYLSFDRRTQLSVFEAADAHQVQRLHGMLQIPIARIWPMQAVV
jgi:hypothetical protein